MADKSAFENTKEAITDNKHSVGEAAPGTPFALVALSYLVILAGVVGIAALVYWTF
ncbi:MULTISPECIES: hypothetical protein [Crateriforma]|uniref:Uncharacterized protein n=1 Tax=Crateriforma conspicua TaxID=2527996 RepID=A0A5C6FZ09_9PLAN|nr:MULTISPECIES: hypothetical protein [Crateriforma]TWU66608.1 hypothetical protein V7x_21770 [Crateriforma conspicua]